MSRPRRRAPAEPVPLLNPAPPWEGERSEFVLLYHGCTLAAKDSIEARGIDLSRCAPDTDFGRGFYTTTLERQARNWAWDQYTRWARHNPGRTENRPVVLRFRVRRYTRRPRRSPQDDGLDGLSTLAFVRGGFADEDYWSLVQHCRQSTPEDVRDQGRRPIGWYDLVCGPVAAFWQQRVAMADYDQFSFHARGVGLLERLIRAGKGRGLDGQGDPDTYRWEFVTQTGGESMLPGHLVAEFWDKVHKLLRTRDRFSPADADAAVAGYREDAVRHGNEMIYHRDPPDAAEVVAGWWMLQNDARRQKDVPA
ncbi:MAG: DUF3990 domain-containing protein [Gemmataceae bacterium]|nr:DUF3990 domain-containing protein [Gemmataceae bacterium]